MARRGPNRVGGAADSTDGAVGVLLPGNALLRRDEEHAGEGSRLFSRRPGRPRRVPAVSRTECQRNGADYVARVPAGAGRIRQAAQSGGTVGVDVRAEATAVR